jgi:hypothetical protein
MQYKYLSITRGQNETISNNNWKHFSTTSEFIFRVSWLDNENIFLINDSIKFQVLDSGRKIWSIDV